MVLAPGERLPSSRTLAATLGVSRTVVTAAYTPFAERVAGGAARIRHLRGRGDGRPVRRRGG